jgi:hypothetical protein
MNAIVPFNDIERMAKAISSSSLFGVKTVDQAIALMLVAQAEGMHPAIAATHYHVINGRPTLKADAMLSRFQAAGGTVNWKTYTDAEVTGTFSHPAGGRVDITWTVAQAQTAGLTKNPTWRQYPRQMLRSRCISEGIRTVYPGVTVGVYTPEEVQDFAPEPPRMAQMAEPRMIEMVSSDMELEAVLRAIAAATTVEELREVWRDIKRLPESDKSAATAAGMARKGEIEGEVK